MPSPDALNAAIAANDAPEVERLLRAGANPNERDVFHGRTPLHTAAHHGATEAAAVLLQHGARVNALSQNVASTPLGDAAILGHLATVRLLVDHGARLSPQEVDTHLLAEARHLGHTAVADFLLQRLPGDDH